jgi:hypothetical protein
MVQDLLELGANIHQKWSTDDLLMVTPFWKPSGQYYNPERNPLDDPYDMLLKYKPNPESMPPLAEDTTFKYPCHIVSQYASEILPHFLKNGAYANIRAGDGSTPIHYAVLGYSLQAVTVLVEAGANINAKTNAERTPVHIVVSLQIGSILEYLLDNGVDIAVDIPTRELQWVTNEPYFNDKSVYQPLDEEIDARARCTQKLHARATPQEVESSIPSG